MSGSEEQEVVEKPEEPKPVAPDASDASEAPSDEEAPAAITDADEMVPVLEAVLFAAPEPVTMSTLRKVFGEETDAELINTALERLGERTAVENRGIRLDQVAGGWQFLTREEYFPFVRRTGRANKEERLSPASLETLAVVAYKQPTTRAEVDAIRGVQSGPLLRSLMDRRLVRVVGRADIPGAPFQYGTTKRFLQHFGLKSVRDLPNPKEVAKMLAERDRA